MEEVSERKSDRIGRVNFRKRQCEFEKRLKKERKRLKARILNAALQGNQAILLHL